MIWWRWGWVASRRLAIDRRSLALLLIYVITPVVAFRGVLHTPLTAATLSLPVVFFALGTLLCLTTLQLTARCWRDGPCAFRRLQRWHGEYGSRLGTITAVIASIHWGRLMPIRRLEQKAS